MAEHRGDCDNNTGKALDVDGDAARATVTISAPGGDVEGFYEVVRQLRDKALQQERRETKWRGVRLMVESATTLGDPPPPQEAQGPHPTKAPRRPPSHPPQAAIRPHTTLTLDERRRLRLPYRGWRCIWLYGKRARVGPGRQSLMGLHS